MTRVADYRQRLRALEDPREFLLTNSNLPGPRSNLELAFAFAEGCSYELALQLAALDAQEAPENTPACFLVCCGLIGLGRFAAEGKEEVLERLRSRANDPRWRVRESVAMGLQRLGDSDIERLLETVEAWSAGSLLEQRAAVAAICEPRLLREAVHATRVISILERVTSSIASAGDRRAEDFRVLRQALAYCWSVAIAAYPDEGKAAFTRWLDSADPDVRYILRENLKKKRLQRLDPAWADRVLAQLQS